MIGKLKNWFRGSAVPAKANEVRPRPQIATGERRKHSDRRQPDVINMDPAVIGNSETQNELVRNKYQREDTGTHETLKIVDDSLLDSGEEAGIDPYNTGNFDRSKNWDKRFRN
jgi:hypothetical protein